MTIRFVPRTACPVCRCEDTEIRCQLDYRSSPLADFIETFYRGRVPLDRFGEACYRVRACPRCELLFQDPVLDDSGLRELYEQWIDPEQSLRKKQAAESRLRRQYRGQIATVAALFAGRRPDSIRVLDYAMGWGFWSAQARAQGFDVSGFELSAARRVHAIKLGISVIDELPGKGGAFDFILANQVFEHLPDPRSSLQELVANLAPGGVIHLRVPDGRGVETSLRQHGWSPRLDAIHPLEHINCYRRETLLQLAAAEGLRAFNPPLRVNPGSLWGSLRRELNDRWLTTHLYLRRN